MRRLWLSLAVLLVALPVAAQTPAPPAVGINPNSLMSPINPFPSSAVNGAGLLSQSCLTYPLGTKSCEDAANTLALKNGLNIQQFNLYNTFTDVNNYERLELEGQGAAPFLVGARNLGTGVARGLTLRGQITSATGWNLDPSNNLKTETDGAVNIGAVGANRPLNIYASGLLSAGTGSQINWYLRSVMQSPADGLVMLSNNLGSGFTRLILGTNDATANGFSWKLNAGNIEAWTGDGLTARAAITASAVTTTGGASIGGAVTSLNGNTTVGGGAPAEVYNTTSAAGATSIIATTMVTPPAAASNYRFSYYLSQAAAGVGCTTNTTIAVALTYRDQNEAAAAASTLATYTITTNGAVGRIALPASGVQAYVFRTNAVAAAIQYATTVTAGTCTTAPTYQITPVLEAF